MNAGNGEKIWSKGFIEDFGVDTLIQFGYSESVLIDGDLLFCVPRSKDNKVVALNCFIRETVWASKGVGEQATYNSPILIEVGTEREGEVALGTKEHWARLVIHEGILYVRHGNALMAYVINGE